MKMLVLLLPITHHTFSQVSDAAVNEFLSIERFSLTHTHTHISVSGEMSAAAIFPFILSAYTCHLPYQRKNSDFVCVCVLDTESHFELPLSEISPSLIFQCIKMSFSVVKQTRTLHL